MVPPETAVEVTEEFAPVPRDLYDVTKFTAEGLCRDAAAAHGLSCTILAARSPFTADETAELLRDPQRVILRHFPAAGKPFATLGW
jgi:nucleoside-diphosphate-sugar epimerase